MRNKMGSRNWLKYLVVLSFVVASGLSARMVFAAMPADQSGGSVNSNPAPNLAGTVPQQVRDGSAKLVGKHTGSDDLVVLFMTPFKDQAGLEAFLADVSNPASPNYGHYLTLAEENARFNPDVSREQKIDAWLRSSGVTNTKLVANHLYVYARANAATLSSLLNVQINDYTLSGRTFYAPDRAPTLPASVSGDVTWIAGLSNVDQLQKMTSTKTKPGSSNGPQDSPPFVPQDYAAAYDVNPLWNAGFKGNGTNIAITLWSLPPSDPTLNGWSTDTGSPVATVANGRLEIILTDGAPSQDTDDGEAALDIESSSGTATQAHIRYYEATQPTNADLANALNMAGTDPTNRFISNSWGGPEGTNARNTIDPVLLANTATGHDYLFSSGDNGSYASNGQDPYPDYPTSSAYATSIGGTRFDGDIVNTWPGEESWLYEAGSPPEGSGGGFSLFAGRPSWQVAPGFPSNRTMRGYPDIAAEADPATGMYVCTDYNGCIQIGGTSLASPLWAGMLDITDQYVVANGGAHLGFVNPAVYRLVNVAQPYAPYHDITIGTNGAYNTNPGWDAVTGLGSPDLYNFARDLGSNRQPTATATPTAGACSSFSDVPPGSTFYPYITCLSGLQVINGYSDCTFRPGNNVTRGQAAKIIANSANYNENIPSTRQTFRDVPSTNPFWVYIERVALHGAISGYQCGASGEPCPGLYFRPSANLTRGQLAKIDSGAVGFNDPIPPTQQTFRDVPPTNAFWVYVERAYMHGVISGYQCGGPGEPCPGNYFHPGSNVTRGQTSKIVANTFFPNCQPRPTATPTHGLPTATSTRVPPSATATRTHTPVPGATNTRTPTYTRTPTRTPTAIGPTATPTCIPLQMTIGPGNPGIPVTIKAGSGANRLLASNKGAHSAPSKPVVWNPLSPISFILDDGSQETSIGWSDQVEAFPAIWLNRFTPPSNAYPLTLNQISVQFPDPFSAGMDLTGQSIDLLVYLDTDGDNNPSNATKLAQIHTTVQVADGVTFSNYAVNIAVPGPGDVYIGFSDTYNHGGVNFPNYPASLDETSPQHRSWLAAMNTVADPDYNNLGNNDTLETIDSAGLAGNWVIRASGTTPSCAP